MLQTLTRSYKALVRAIAGHEYRTIHISPTGARKVFHNTNLQDAIEWVGCALNEDQVKIIDRSGYLVCSRARIKA